MIHGIYGQTITSYLSLLESNLNTSVSNTNLRYLFKFTNDLTKTVKYSYGRKTSTNDRYIKNDFLHNTTDSVLDFTINFKPYGFWKYEVYEVTWIGTVFLEVGNAPTTETHILSVHNDNGVVKGKVEEGKLYIQETAGSEQIKYTQHTTTETNYLHTN